MKLVEILLVEDNPSDVHWFRLYFEEWQFANRFNVVNDGVEALAYLRQTGKYADAPTPDLVLTDLNLPKLTGDELIREMKADPALSAIPVIVLTGSGWDRAVVQKLGLEDACYLVKPITTDRLVDGLRCYGNFRLAIVRDEAVESIGADERT